MECGKESCRDLWKKYNIFEDFLYETNVIIRYKGDIIQYAES